LKAVFDQLKDFESVGKAIREEHMDLLSVRRLFDALIEKYPEVECWRWT
jgi:hypothetical protein